MTQEKRYKEAMIAKIKERRGIRVSAKRECEEIEQVGEEQESRRAMS